ncbi:toll/interleukin-1 receptor domain-containing protein [Dictyobacter formicarum]|uniref:TIR domain-containing protein n=1 Tax=Dictyobacter formicarum TaxID=2778368 RepID=A0ABQ3VR00_9CHLR|nr:toll/interleukin-1 receptor domain-containing protein [Dictyobacter formicarum]GHO88245.1 hypothetical protein KSZ_62510 [Dictyobacter formicarum]
MSSPSSPPRASVTILLIVLGGVLSALASILGNLATSTIPPAIAPYLRFAFPAFFVAVALGIGVSVWQARREASASLPIQPRQEKIASPSPAPAPTQQLHTSSEYHSCVLSYATEDQAFAEKLYADLHSSGVPCWFAPHDLKTGDKLRDNIYEAIQNNDKLLIVLSEHAIGSRWVEEEVEAALDREHMQQGTFLLFPIRLDDHVLQTYKSWAIAVRQRYIGDFRRWQDDMAYTQAFHRLARDLHR